MNFENPKYLWFLLALPLYIIAKFTKFGKGFWDNTTFPFPSFLIINRKKKMTFSLLITAIREILFLSVIFCLIIALARPRGGSAIVSNNYLGVDIILITDLSGSMIFIDEPPANVRRVNYMGTEHYVDTNGDLKNQTRLEVAKRVIKNYIEKQEFNRIGLVLFASYAVTKAPLSTDKQLLKKLIDEISFFDEGATAIGTGILTGLNRIKNSKAKSKVMILLTDGINNAGIVDPISAANVARELGVKIYTIGIGNTKGSLQPVDNGQTYVYRSGGEFDPQTLQEIADITGGKFFEASSETALQDVYNEIDSLEKSEVEVKRRVLYEEQFRQWIIFSVLFLFFWLLFNALIVKIP